MVYFRTAFKNLRINPQITVIVFLQITGTMIAVFMLISALLIRFQYYKPLEKYFTSNGIYGIFVPYAMSTDSNMRTNNELIDDDDLLELYPDSEEVLGSAIPYCYIENKEFNSYAYTDNLIDCFSPEIERGNWLSTDNNKNEIVISENDYGWDVGDRLELNFFNKSESMKYTFEVVGVLKNNTIIPTSYTNQYDPDFTQFFSVYSYDIEEKPLILMRLNTLKDLDKESGLIRAMTGGFIITFSDSVNDEELNEYSSELSSNNSVVSIKLKDMQENNKAYLYKRMYDLFPLILILMILTTVSCISSSALTMRMRLRDYTIFYICGQRWNQCVFINALSSLVIGIASFITALLLLFVLRITNMLDSIKIIISIEGILTMAAVLIFYVAVSMIMPAIMISRRTPKEIITS